MKQILKPIILFCVTVLISGCASTLERAFTPPGHVNFYPGIGANYDILTDEKEDMSIRVIMGVIDIPFSLVLDTVFLPFDTFDYFMFKSDDKGETENIQKENPPVQQREHVTGESVDEILRQVTETKP